jgi:hypothetical protein
LSRDLAEVVTSHSDVWREAAHSFLSPRQKHVGVSKGSKISEPGAWSQSKEVRKGRRNLNHYGVFGFYSELDGRHWRILSWGVI